MAFLIEQHHLRLADDVGPLSAERPWRRGMEPNDGPRSDLHPRRPLARPWNLEPI